MSFTFRERNTNFYHLCCPYSCCHRQVSLLLPLTHELVNMKHQSSEWVGKNTCSDKHWHGSQNHTNLLFQRTKEAAVQKFNWLLEGCLGLFRVKLTDSGLGAKGISNMKLGHTGGVVVISQEERPMGVSLCYSYSAGRRVQVRMLPGFGIRQTGQDRGLTVVPGLCDSTQIQIPSCLVCCL